MPVDIDLLKDETTSITLRPYRDSEGSRSSSSNEDAHAEREQDEVLASDLLSTDPLIGVNKRRKRKLFNVWTITPLFLVAILVSFALGTLSAPRLPPWVRDRLKSLKLSSEDLWQYTSATLLPVHRPWNNAADYVAEDLPAACQNIPKGTLYKFRGAQNITLQMIVDNQTVTSETELIAPLSVCILVAVPQHEFRNGSYPDAPVPDKGPDAVHMYLNSTEVIVTMPPLRPLPNQPDSVLQFSQHPIVYYAEVPIYNGGTYEIIGENEFTNWRWAQEWHITEQNQWLMVTGEPAGDVIMDHQYEPESLPSRNFTVKGPRHLPSRPPCDDKINAGLGRWYKYESFPVLPSELVDEWGYTWQGDQCYLDYYSPMDSLDCLSDKTIHFYGDSMIRRIAKTIMSGGKWCLDPWAPCQDEDDGINEPVPKLDFDEDGGIVVDSIIREQHFQAADRSSINFGKNSSMHFTFLTALAGSTGMWMNSLYDKERLYKPRPEDGVRGDTAVMMNTTARPPPDMKKADLVILGFGAWDQAFTDRYDEYERQITVFRDAFLQAYEGVPIIMRLSNSWCCRGTHSLFRRYTGPRIQEFDDRTRKVFQVEGGQAMGGRIRVLDPANMNGRPDVIYDYKVSNPNHPRASHVRIEMQMLMNSICKRGSDGSISFRDT